MFQKGRLNAGAKEGLLCRKYIFSGGISGIGFSSSAVEEFAGKNAELVKKASQFSTILAGGPQDIIEMAQQSWLRRRFEQNGGNKKGSCSFQKSA